MRIKKTTLFLALSFLFLFLVLSSAFFVYVFGYTGWETETKIFALLGYVIVLLLGVIKYQLVAKQRLLYKLTASGLGEERVFADLYQNSPVPYVRTNAQGRILHVNTATVRLFAHEIEELTALNLFALLQEVIADEETRLVSLEQKVKKGQFVNEVEVKIPLAAGGIKWALLSAFPYNANRERLVTIIDITEQKKVDQAKTEFVSLASHQLRTPIAAMLWNLELLAAKTEGFTSEQLERLNKVEHSVQKMKSLVGDFLDATKLEMGTFATKPVSVSVNTLLQSICSEFESQIVQKALSLSPELLPTDVTIQSDERLLHIIFSNLISNAVKYTPEEGTVFVRIATNADRIVFTVQDTGIGVPESDQPLLFSKLYRASNVKTSETEGTGLGLYAVKQAVEILGGDISFTSIEGKGTKFVVSLPYQV